MKRVLTAILTFFLVPLVAGIFNREWRYIFSVAVASAMIIICCTPDHCRKKKDHKTKASSDEHFADSELLQKAINKLCTLSEEDIQTLLPLMERLKKKE